jgi:NhaC family Na+:H+ antiporter
MQTDTPKAGRQREPSIVDALTLIGVLVGLLSLSYILFHDEASYGPNQVALLFCSLAAAARYGSFDEERHCNLHH